MPKKKGCVMTKNVPAFIARIQFGQILERASKNKERFLVTKKGEAKAIILGVEDFLQAIVETPKSLSALQEQAKKSGSDKLTLEEIEKGIWIRAKPASSPSRTARSTSLKGVSVGLDLKPLFLGLRLV
jgi:prevent-host-death family protein